MSSGNQIVAELEAHGSSARTKFRRKPIGWPAIAGFRIERPPGRRVEHARQHALHFMGAAILGIGASLSDDRAEREGWRWPKARRHGPDVGTQTIFSIGAMR